MNKKILPLFLILSCLSLGGCSNVPQNSVHKGVNKYLVTFDSRGGSKIDPLLTNRIEEMPVPNKNNHSFNGWYLEDTNNLISFPYDVTKDQTLFASWKFEKYNVKFETNGGSKVADLEHVDIINECPVSVKEGYDLLGWTLENNSNVITYPYHIYRDLTLYASWKRKEVNPKGKLLSIAKINAMEARSYWSFEYLDNSIKIHAEVIDEILYGYENNPGFNDNIEVVLTPESRSLPSGLNIGNTHHFIIDINGHGYYNYANSLSGWSEATNYPEGSSATVSINNPDIDGFSGYKVDFFVPYSLFGFTKIEALNKLTMTVGMRNTNAHTASSWNDALDNDYMSSWTYFTLKENGEFKDTSVLPKTLLIGDSNYSCLNWSNINSNLTSYDAFAYSKDFEINEWNERIDNVLSIDAEKVILNFGRVDYNHGEHNNAEIVDGIASLLDKCAQKYNPNNIFLTSLEPFKNYSSRLKDLSSLNESLQEICIEKNINYIDTFNIFLKADKTLDDTLFKNNFNFSSSGFTKYFETIKSYL